MNSRGIAFRPWLRAAAIFALVAVCCGMAPAKPAVKIDDKKTPEWHPPLMVDNPFVAKPVDKPSDRMPSIVGAEVDPDILPIYRLPHIDDDTSPDLPQVSTSRVSSTHESLTKSQDVAGPVFTHQGDVDSVTDDQSAAMLDDMDQFWTNQFTATPRGSLAPVDATPYTTTVAELSQQLLPSVREAYGLAQHGALYAAQAEFIQVLRRIAQAKDAEQGTDEHSRALAAGLRALDEAEDFAPKGVALEAELNVAVLVSSHRTPVLAGHGADVLPHDAIARYHQYAELELGRAVAGEPAGSMTLHGLGKVYNRLALETDGDPRFERKAMTMFLAALVARPDNHLAANEVGVLLAKGGHAAQAAEVLKRAIDLTPTSTSYHNLAVVERQLGQHAYAAANDLYAQQLAARDRAIGAVSRNKGIAWVAPNEFSRSSPPPTTGYATAAPRGPAVPNSPMRADGPRTGVPTVARWPQKLIPGIFRR